MYTTDIVNLYVKYIRKQILQEEYDSDDAKVFLNWEGKPLIMGVMNRKVKSFFARYGYDLTVTRLREIVATHIEESSQQLTSTGLINEIFDEINTH